MELEAAFECLWDGNLNSFWELNFLKVKFEISKTILLLEIISEV
jgi:hypothetical protein